jgi:hypothetical protein
MIEQYGEIKYFDGSKLYKREMTDEELKCMMGNIKLNQGMSLPDQLLSDFMMGGPSKPTMKNCIHFNKNDFKNIVTPLKPKNIKKPYPKIKTHKKKLRPISKSSAKKTSKVMKNKNKI